jgi:hypothetical protein
MTVPTLFSKYHQGLVDLGRQFLVLAERRALDRIVGLILPASFLVAFSL